jgi:hypothetical protein
MTDARQLLWTMTTGATTSSRRPSGAPDHQRHEHASVALIPPRVALLAALRFGNSFDGAARSEQLFGTPIPYRG